MSQPSGPPGADASGPEPWMPPRTSPTPNAERYLLEADALRRRQLVSALLHGSRRTWREQRRIWPWVVAGIVVVAVIVAVFGVLRAIHGADSSSSIELGCWQSVPTTSQREMSWRKVSQLGLATPLARNSPPCHSL